MDYFVLHPDFLTLVKYFDFDHTPEKLDELYKDGYDIHIEPYKNRKQQWRFDSEHIQSVQRDFREIAIKYDLKSHYDNLLTLILLNISTTEQVYNHTYDQLQYRKRAKELAKLILSVKKNRQRPASSLVLKTLTDTAKITDPKLLEWMMKFVVDAIEQGKVPYSLLGFEDQSMLTDEKLEVMANQTISNAKLKRPLADFCFELYPYLINETNIRPDPSTLISDMMANFFFEVLNLFEYINYERIGSAPSDYIHALLRNQINKLNT